jgi:hypothetical protein
VKAGERTYALVGPISLLNCGSLRGLCSCGRGGQLGAGAF